MVVDNGLRSSFLNKVSVAPYPDNDGKISIAQALSTWEMLEVYYHTRCTQYRNNVHAVILP